MGRSQAASIFWGLVSVFFAAAASYYFWKDHEHETSANVLRDQVLTLEEQRETLNSQKDELQSSMSESEAQLKTREDFLQEKETKLADEESRLDALGQQGQSQSEQSQAQAPVVKKFNEAARKLVKDGDTDVVVRGGRPVLRVPSSVFFSFGETTLKPTGKALLDQIAQAMNGQLDNFELRIELFTDSDGETPKTDDKTPPAATTSPASTNKDLAPPPDKPAPAANQPREGADWTLTGARAAVIGQYVREKTSLPFQNLLVVPRADFQPIVPAGNEAHARNRRVEITITPLPVPYHPLDTSSSSPDAPEGSANKAASKSAKVHSDKSGDASKSKKNEDQ